MDNAEYYEAFNWENEAFSNSDVRIQKILSFIPKEAKTIIDIGCGNGVITNALANYYDVTGVDRSHKALSYVKTKKIQASCDSIPVENNSFDVVFSSELLEHLEDDLFFKTISEFKRISKKYLLISVPHNEDLDKLNIKCVHCGAIFNFCLHHRSFIATDFEKLFPEYNILETAVFGTLIRPYRKSWSKLKHKLTPAKSWIPKLWLKGDNRKTFCPSCEKEFMIPYQFNPIALGFDFLNILTTTKKPYWLLMLLKLKD